MIKPHLKFNILFSICLCTIFFYRDSQSYSLLVGGILIAITLACGATLHSKPSLVAYSIVALGLSSLGTANTAGYELLSTSAILMLLPLGILLGQHKQFKTQVLYYFGVLLMLATIPSIYLKFKGLLPHWLATDVGVQGSWLALACLWSLSAGLNPEFSRKSRHIWLSLAGIAYLLIGALGSRGAFLGLSTILLLAVFLLRKEISVYWLKRLVFGFLVIVVLAAPSLIAKFQNNQGKSFEARMSLYSQTIAMISENPQGVGLGMWKQVYPQYRKAEDNESAGVLVHNDYLQLYAEIGPLSVVIWLLLWMRAIQQIRHNPSKTQRMLHLSSIFLLIEALLNFVIYVPALTLVLGLLLGLPNSKDSGLTTKYKFPILKISTLLLGTYTSCFLFLSQYLPKAIEGGTWERRINLTVDLASQTKALASLFPKGTGFFNQLEFPKLLLELHTAYINKNKEKTAEILEHLIHIVDKSFVLEPYTAELPLTKVQAMLRYGEFAELPLLTERLEQACQQAFKANPANLQSVTMQVLNQLNKGNYESASQTVQIFKSKAGIAQYAQADLLMAWIADQSNKPNKSMKDSYTEFLRFKNKAKSPKTGSF